MARILLLNGTSSSGKTMIARILQRELRDPPWMLMKVDAFLTMMPPHADKSVRKWIRPFAAAYYKSIATFARAGFPVIVDTVFEHRDFVVDYKAATRGIKTIYVGLFCPVKVLERRERRRRDRQIGMARAQHPLVHRHVKYHLRLDSHRKTSEACARKIIRYLRRRRIIGSR